MLEGLFPEDVETAWGDPRRAAPELLPEEALVVAQAVNKRQREFAHGRAFARELLERFGIRDFALLPAPTREPIWPAGIVGSVSHTDGLCAVAVSTVERYAGIGIDVEPDAALPHGLAPRICREEEIEQSARLEGFDAATAQRLFFSAKEAVYKSQFGLTREFLGFFDVSIRFEPDGRFCARILPPLRALVGERRALEGRWARRGGFLLSAAWIR